MFYFLRRRKVARRNEVKSVGAAPPLTLTSTRDLVGERCFQFTGSWLLPAALRYCTRTVPRASAILVLSSLSASPHGTRSTNRNPLLVQYERTVVRQCLIFQPPRRESTMLLHCTRGACYSYMLHPPLCRACTTLPHSHQDPL